MPMRDLVILVSDKNMQFGVRGLLERPQALGIRSVDYEIYRHPHNDPGCLNGAHEFLRMFTTGFNYALVLFDRHGCGRENNSRSEELEKLVTGQLEVNGWQGRSETIVFDPELEVWVWSKSPKVEENLGWSGKNPKLMRWLENSGLWLTTDTKPRDPKIAMEKALQEVSQPRSSNIYYELGKTVGTSDCTDKAMIRFKSILQNWFPLN